MARRTADSTKPSNPYQPGRENPFTPTGPADNLSTEDGPLEDPAPGPMTMEQPTTTRPRGGDSDPMPEPMPARPVARLASAGLRCPNCGSDRIFEIPSRWTSLTCAECEWEGVVEEAAAAARYPMPVAASLRRTAQQIHYAEIVPFTRVPNSRCVVAYAMDGERLVPLGGIVFNDEELVSIVVLDFARQRGIGRTLVAKMDELAGRPLPDDGYRTMDGSKFLNALGRPKVPFKRRVTDHDAARPFGSLFMALTFGQVPDEMIRPLASRHTAVLRIAHDSGDGKRLFHCPFCGSGNIIALSDGSTRCEHCRNSFTVQVQPEFSAMPQTNPDGTPVNMQDMPGEPAERPTYDTDQGVALDENDYVARLAMLAVRDEADRARVAASVRRARARA